jgi:hypothetical protein
LRSCSSTAKRCTPFNQRPATYWTEHIVPEGRSGHR